MRHIAISLVSLFIASLLYGADDIRLRTVVIDAGHGGKDPGAVSRNKLVYEKMFTLDIAVRLGNLISSSYPDVKVILTRTSDDFISLSERADIANKNNANLFISIHINSSTSTSLNGYSIHVLGDSNVKDRDLLAYNMDVVQRENAVIYLEDDTARYKDFNPDDTSSFIFLRLMQSSNLQQSLKFAQIIDTKMKGGPIKSGKGIWQNPFYVLWKTSMPAVLVELGFLSNNADLDVLRQTSNRDELARRLFESFRQYKTLYDNSGEAAAASLPAPSETVSVPEKDEHPLPDPESDTIVEYGIQIFAVDRLLSPDDPLFLGYAARSFGERPKKYVIGISTDRKEAEKNFLSIKKKYPKCFLVKIEKNMLSLVR